MRSISEIETFGDEFELFILPDVRIIGKETRCGGNLGNTAPEFLEKLFASEDYKTIKKLSSLIPGVVFDWTCDFDPSDNTYSFIHCVIAKAGTVVPEGLEYRDIPATAVAKGELGKAMDATVKRANERGYITNWEPYPWNAEYFVAEKGKSHWFTPVKEQGKM